MALDYTGAGAVLFDEPASLILQAPIPVVADTVLRLTVTVRKASGSDASLTAGVLCYDDAMAEIVGGFANHEARALADGLTVSSTTFQDLTVDVVIGVNADDMRAGTTQVVLFLQQSVSGSEIEVDGFGWEDVSESTKTASDVVATAANTATTTTKATEAAASALAASQDRIAAATSQAAAAVSQANTAISASTATDAAAGAVSARDVAARVMGGGQSPNPIFAQPDSDLTAKPDDYGWSATNGSSMTRNGTSGKYGACVEYTTGSTLDANQPYLLMTGATAAVDGLIASEVSAVEIDFEVEMTTGTWGSACIIVEWLAGNGGTSQSVVIYLQDALTSTAGKVQRLKALVERPAGYVAGADDELRVVFYGNIDGDAKGEVNHTARIHRFDYQVVAASASALISQKAITDLEGNALASFVLRTRAGTSDGSMEIASASDPNGSSTKIKLRADEIELDGMAVFKDNLESDIFATGDEGWRITRSGGAEFNGVVLSRDMVIEEGYFTIGNIGGAGAALTEVATYWIETTTSNAAWQAPEFNYVADVGRRAGSGYGVINADSGIVSSAPETIQWGWTAEVVPITRWSGAQVLWLKVTYYARNVVSGTNWQLHWKLKRVT